MKRLLRPIACLAVAGLAACTPNLEPRVRSNIDAIPGLGAHSLTIEQRGSDIVLQGNVDSHKDRMVIGEAASQTPGVRAVENALMVRPIPGATTPGRVSLVLPSTQAAQIQSKILATPGLTGYDVVVSVDSHGVVTLNGVVQSEQDRAVIDSIARSTPGVRALNDQLAVVESSSARVAG